METCFSFSIKNSGKSEPSDAKVCDQQMDIIAQERSFSESIAAKKGPSSDKVNKSFSKLKIGVLALQGAFAKHCEMITKLGASSILVKKPEDLLKIDALIIPGGESTTMLHQIRFINLFPALHDFARHKPIFGTCAGLILMSNQKSTVHKDDSLEALDVVVERNAFGRQVESFKANLEVMLPASKSFSYPAIFIRAPRIKQIGPKVTILSAYEGEPVLIQQGIHMASSFHPELTDDLRIHSYFLSQVEKSKNGN